MKFDMETMPWYIRIDNLTATEKAAVKEWLSVRYEFLPNNSKIEYYTNVLCDDRSVRGRTAIYWGIDYEKVNPLAKEIKRTFRSTIDNVIYPEVESETEKQIRELKDTISKAQKQIEESGKLQG